MYPNTCLEDERREWIEIVVSEEKKQLNKSRKIDILMKCSVN